MKVQVESVKTVFVSSDVQDTPGHTSHRFEKIKFKWDYTTATDVWSLCELMKCLHEYCGSDNSRNSHGFHAHTMSCLYIGGCEDVP